MNIRAFREAAKAQPLWNCAKTFTQMIVFWSVFLFIIPQLLVRIEQAIHFRSFNFVSQQWLATVVFVCCSILGVASAFVVATRGKGTPLPIDCPCELVIIGPYRWIRNPMAVAGLGQGVAVGIWYGSWLILMYVLIGGIIWNWFVRPAEERDLANRFGNEYEQYQQNVRCWIPRWPRKNQ